MDAAYEAALGHGNMFFPPASKQAKIFARTGCQV
jgi:hypothetical protein